MRWDSDNVAIMVCALCLTVAFCVLITNVRGCVETVDKYRVEQKMGAK